MNSAWNDIPQFISVILGQKAIDADGLNASLPYETPLAVMLAQKKSTAINSFREGRLFINLC